MTDKKNILIVEDDPAIQKLLKVSLQNDYNVNAVSMAQEGADFVVKNIVDLIILDLGLPDMDGINLIRIVREFSGRLPILVVSARGDDFEKVKVLDAGADDYIQKPFSTAELLARIRVCLRHNLDSGDSKIFINGGLKIDYTSHSVYVDGSEVHLTNYEYKILCVLAENAGKTLTHNYIISKVWGAGGNDSAGLRVFMAAIRRKIEESSCSQTFIRTDVGVGYRMNKL